MKITDNFSFSEFSNRDPKMLSPVQWFMLQHLCNDLELIRSFLCNYYNKDISIKISSGIRLPSDNNALRKAGYNPSETSDHFFGNIVKLRNKRKIKLYGMYYIFSVGACDWVPACGAKKAFELLMPYFNLKTGGIDLPGIPKGSLKIGQLILEKRNTYWIHQGNSPDLIFSEQVCDTFLNRKYRFMRSENNGASYQPIV